MGNQGTKFIWKNYDQVLNLKKCSIHDSKISDRLLRTLGKELYSYRGLFTGNLGVNKTES